MARLVSRHGSEGPKHDPYSFEEISYANGKTEVVLHLGLTEYIRVNGVIDTPPFFLKCDKCIKSWMNHVWKHYTGMSIERARKIIERLNNPTKCKECGCSRFECVSGFPGELFKICSKCDTVVASQFNKSEIE